MSDEQATQEVRSQTARPARPAGPAGRRSGGSRAEAKDGTTQRMRCDVVVKTHYRDLAFCSYALRFLEKNWTDEDSAIITIANADCKPVIEQWRFPAKFKFFYVDPWPDGNQFQCYLTLLLDNFSDAGLFAIFDSDTMLIEPMGSRDKMINGCPIIYCKMEADMLASEESKVAHKLWMPLMEHWLGERPPGDFMWTFPFIYYASSLAAVRRLITNKTGRGLFESLYSETPFNPWNFENHPFKFCEHNVISFHCSLRERYRYRVLNLKQLKHSPVRQYHSWTQWSPQTQTELDDLLAKPMSLKTS